MSCQSRQFWLSSSQVVEIKPSSSPPTKSAVFMRRGFSTLILWAVVATLFTSMHPIAYLGLVVVLVTISTLEYFNMLRSENVKCFPRYGLFLAVGYCCLSSWSLLNGAIDIPPSLDAFAWFMAATGAFTLQLRYSIKGTEALLAVAANLLGFVYIAYLFSYVSRIAFGLGDEGSVPGAYVLLWLLAVTKFTDMGAYITGSLIGKHKMIPNVSPAKTWEGFVGALLFAQLAGCGLFWLMPDHLDALHSWKHVIILGFLLSLLAVIGDLAESVIKRSLNAKDSGKMLPGIGGGLDLIDSICFTAPALWFYLKGVIPLCV